MKGITRYIKNKKRIILGAAILAISAICTSVIPVHGAPAGPTRSNRGVSDAFTVVIDAGHGGHDTGAADNGVREKDINLGVAQKLAEMIRKKMKDAKVVMTRDEDTFVSLQERANIANRNRGNLFVSIHTNSVDKKNPKRSTVSGSSVYALGLHKDASNQQVARRENSVIELESDYEQKYSGFDPSKDESYIIFEMAQKKNLGQSLRFANSAQKELTGVAGRADRGVKQAGFWVLWATSMPAVLVELDFICNPESARFMGSDEGQEKLAKALFNAIEEYAEHYSVSLKDVKQKEGKNNNSNKNKSSKGKNKRKDRNSRQKDAGERADNGTATQGSGDQSNVIPVLATPAKTAERRRTENTGSNNRSMNYAEARTRGAQSVGHRKRRSAASKQVSDSRSIDNKKIELTDESRYLAKVEKAPDAKQPSQPVDDKNTKGKKNKKSKKTKDNKVKAGKNNKVSMPANKNKENVKIAGAGDAKKTVDKNTKFDKKRKQMKQQPKKEKRHTSLAGKRAVRTELSGRTVTDGND